jgi:hypothetical protein
LKVGLNLIKPTMNAINNPTSLISFALEALADAKRLLNDYSSRFSRKDFTQPQLMALAGLRQRYRLRWRELEELVTEMPRLRAVLDLRKIPDFSTIPKFLKRIPSGLLNKLFKPEKCEVLGIDASGFSSSVASPHYERRCFKKRAFLKASIAVDIDSLRVYALKIRKSHAHDSRDFAGLANKCDFRILVADKAYDDEKIHCRVHEMGAESVIPIRQYKRNRTKGIYRSIMDSEFDYETYHQRSKVESVFSIIKRKLGESVSGRSISMQRKELKIKFWAYNVDRQIVLRVLHRLVRRCLWWRVSTEPKKCY